MWLALKITYAFACVFTQTFVTGVQLKSCTNLHTQANYKCNQWLSLHEPIMLLALPVIPSWTVSHNFYAFILIYYNSIT